jgi:predicted SprT family Zn-dependent metalloprotease
MISNTQEAVDEPPRYADCDCGQRMVLSQAIQESPHGTPYHCPACGRAWRIWQLIVRSRRPGAGS